MCQTHLGGRMAILVHLIDLLPYASILASREATEGAVYHFGQVLCNWTFIRVWHEGFLGTRSATKKVLFFLFPFSTPFTLALGWGPQKKGE